MRSGSWTEPWTIWPPGLGAWAEVPVARVRRASRTARAIRIMKGPPSRRRVSCGKPSTPRRARLPLRFRSLNTDADHPQPVEEAGHVWPRRDSACRRRLLDVGGLNLPATDGGNDLAGRLPSTPV